MQHQVDERQAERPPTAVEPEDKAHQTGHDAYHQIEHDSRLLAHMDHEGILASLLVGIAVAEIIDQQQSVDHDATGQ